MEKIDFKLDIENKEISELKKQFFNEIINDSLLYENIIKLGFTNKDIFDNLSKFIDYKKNFYIVKEIKTYDDCVKANTYYELIPTKDELTGEVNLKKIILEPVKLKKRYDNCFIEKDFENKFNNIKLNSKLIKLNNEYKKKNTKNLYILGETRTGKSYFAIGYINKKINQAISYDKYITIAFIDCAKRFPILETYGKSFNIYDKEIFEEKLSQYKECDYLILDGFGSEKKTEFTRDGILIPLLNERILNKKVTIITSRYDFDEIESLYAELGFKTTQSSKLKAKEVKNLLKVLFFSESNTISVPNIY